MNNKDLANHQEFENEDLVFSLKERIRQGITLPLSKGDIKEDNGNYYQHVKEFFNLSSKKALLWFSISYKCDLSGENIWEINIYEFELWRRSHVFVPTKLNTNQKRELASLIKSHIKIDKNMQDLF